MCGFLCQINRKGKAININKNLLKHRGPDFTKECAYESISIRHWRLAIVDLTDSSNQPYENEDYLFAYNGETNCSYWAIKSKKQVLIEFKVTLKL